LIIVLETSFLSFPFPGECKVNEPIFLSIDIHITFLSTIWIGHCVKINERK